MGIVERSGEQYGRLAMLKICVALNKEKGIYKNAIPDSIKVCFHNATKNNFITLDKIVFIGYIINRDWLMKPIWAGRKTLVHRTAGNFPAIFIYMW